jgi:hypothetical protein
MLQMLLCVSTVAFCMVKKVPFGPAERLFLMLIIIIIIKFVQRRTEGVGRGVPGPGGGGSRDTPCGKTLQAHANPTAFFVRAQTRDRLYQSRKLQGCGTRGRERRGRGARQLARSPPPGQLTDSTSALNRLVSRP